MFFVMHGGRRHESCSSGFLRGEAPSWLRAYGRMIAAEVAPLQVRSLRGVFVPKRRILLARVILACVALDTAGYGV